MTEEKILTEINRILDENIINQTKIWEQQVVYRKYENAEEIQKIIKLLTKIKTQINNTPMINEKK